MIVVAVIAGVVKNHKSEEMRKEEQKEEQKREVRKKREKEKKRKGAAEERGKSHGVCADVCRALFCYTLMSTFQYTVHRYSSAQLYPAVFQLYSTVSVHCHASSLCTDTQLSSTAAQLVASSPRHWTWGSEVAVRR